MNAAILAKAFRAAAEANKPMMHQQQSGPMQQYQEHLMVPYDRAAEQVKTAVYSTLSAIAWAFEVAAKEEAS